MKPSKSSLNPHDVTNNPPRMSVEVNKIVIRRKLFIIRSGNLTMAVQQEVSEEYRETLVPMLKMLTHREQWAANVFAYWMRDIPLDPELDELRSNMGKVVYDEMRHRNIMERMVGHFGGQEEIESMHQQWKEWGEYNWMNRMGTIFTDGVSDYIEFLTTLPLHGDLTGHFLFTDLANCADDPVWSDAAESVVEDEDLHISLPRQYLPILVERYGDEARESIKKGIRWWFRPLNSIQGHPIHDTKSRQYVIEKGVSSRTINDVRKEMFEHYDEIFDPLGIEIPDPDPEQYPKSEEIPDVCEKNYMKRKNMGER
jgi:1,2-phenylacetyl-CoA epoxidase catalytic subunit